MNREAYEFLKQNGLLKGNEFIDNEPAPVKSESEADSFLREQGLQSNTTKVKSIFSTDDTTYKKKLADYEASKPKVDQETIDAMDRKRFLENLIYNSPNRKQSDMLTEYQQNPELQKMVGKINVERPKQVKSFEQVRRESQIIRNEQDYQNRPAEDSLTGGLYGFQDSLPGAVIDYAKGARGGSSYRLHTDSWGKRLLVDPEAKKRVLTDLSYITGKLLGDMPVILGLGAATGGLGLTGATGAGVTTGGFSALSSMATQKRDKDDIDFWDATKEGMVGAVTGMATVGAGNLAKTIGGVTKVIGAKNIPAITGKIQPVTKVIGALNKYGAETVAQAEIPALMQGRSATKEDFINAIAPTILTEGAVRSATVGKNFMHPTKYAESKIESPLTQIKGDDVPNITSQDNAIYWNEKLKQDADAGNDPRTATRRLAMDEVVSLQNAHEVLNLYKSKSAKGLKKEEFGVAQKAEFLTNRMKELENITGESTGMLDHNGVIKDHYVMNRKELVKYMEEQKQEIADARKALKEETGTEYLDTDEADISFIEHLLMDGLNKRYLDLSKDKRKIAEIRKEVGINPKEQAKVISTLNKEATRSQEYSKIIDENMHYNPGEKKVLKDFVTTSDKQVNDLVNKMSYSRLSRLEKMTQFVTNVPLLYKKHLGDAMTQLIINPMRHVDKEIIRETERLYDTVFEKGGKVSEKEMRKLMIYRIGKQVNKSGAKVGLDNIKQMLERGEISQKEIIKSLDELSPEAKAFYKMMNDELSYALKEENKIERALGRPEQKGLGAEYVPMKSTWDLWSLDQNQYNSKENPALVKKIVEGADVFSKVFRRGKGLQSVSLDGVEVMLAHLEKSIRQRNTAVVSQKIKDIADKLKSSGRDDIADVVTNHANYWSGQYVDSTVPAWARGAINKLNNNINQAMLSFGISTILSNSLTFNNAVSMLGNKRVFDAYEKVCSNYAEGYSTPKDISPAVSARLTNIASRKAVGTHTSSKLQKAKTGLAQIGLTTMEFVDHLNAEVAFQASYDYFLREKGMTDTDAIYNAGEFVNMTQGSGSRIDLAPVHRGALGKLFLSFTTFPVANLNFLVSKAYGLNNGLAHVQSFENEKDAKLFAEENGYIVKEDTDAFGKKQWTVYDKEVEATNADRIKRALYFTMFNTASNALAQTMSNKTGLSVSAGGSNPLSVAYSIGTGKTLEDELLRKKGGRKPNVAQGLLSLAGEMPVPVAQSMLKHGKASGVTIGTVDRIAQDYMYLAQKPTLRKTARLINDISVLYGNPSHKLGSYVLQATNPRNSKK